MLAELLRRGERIADQYEVITACCQSALWVGFSCLHLLVPPVRGRTYDTRKPSVLLKIVRPELVREPSTRDRLLRELRRVQALDQPGLVPLVDVQLVETQKTVLLIDSCTAVPSRHLSGLRTEVGTEHFDIESMHKRMLALAAVLGNLHKQGMCHGDLRPETVLLFAEKPRALLRDLGLGPSLPRADYLQAINHRDGLALVAPEVRDGRAPDPRADVFALAAMYQGFLKSYYEQEHSSPRRAYPTQEQVLARGLRDEPAQRYESGAALRSALAGALRG